MGEVDNKQHSTLHHLVRIPQRPAFCVFVFFLTFYYLTNAGWYKAGDENFMCRVAKQIVEERQIGFNLKRPLDEEYKDFCIKGPNGLFYYKWGLGQSLVEVPFYFIHHLIWRPSPSYNVTSNFLNAKYITELILVFLCPSAISALGCALVFLLGLRLGFSRGVSLCLSLVYGFGTMVWPYSKSLMADTTVSVAILGGVYGAVSYVLNRSRWLLSVSGMCLGFASITKITSVVAVPVIIVYILFTIRSRKAVRDLFINFAPLFMVLFGVQLWHNAIRYGNLWRFGYDYGADGAFGFCTPLYVGLWGLLASPGKSFFLYTPIAFLCLVSAKRFFQVRRSEAFLFMAISVMFIILHARWWAWAGDWAWGPRFLLVITPYLILPSGLFFERWSKLLLSQRTLIIMLIVFSVVVQILGVSVHPFSFIHTRTQVITKIVNKDYQGLDTYAWAYGENAFVNFSPMFSHVVGNWWLFKHMIFSYDIWSDVPWRVMGEFNLTLPWWVKNNRTVPFWWPASFPLISPLAKIWVYSLAAANLLIVFWWGLRVKRLFQNHT